MLTPHFLAFVSLFPVAQNATAVSPTPSSRASSTAVPAPNTASTGALAGACQAEWIPTFGPTNAFDGAVHALHEFDDGSGAALYLAGAFRVGGSQLLRGVARWNGAGLEPLGGGVVGSSSERVDDLISYDSGGGAQLHAVGAFAAGGGLVRWSGSTWAPLGAGLSLASPSYPGQYSWLYSAESYDQGSGPELYVAGNFTLAGNVPAAGFAKWNGSTWSAVTPAPTATFAVVDMQVFDDGSGPELYCAGNAGVWKLGPSGWSNVSSGVSSVTKLYVCDLGTGPALYALGASGIARWSGTNWVNQSCPMVSLNSMARFDDGSGPRLFVQGVVAGSGRLAAWNGAAWQLLPDILVGYNGGAGLAYAMREFNDGGGQQLFVGGILTHVGGVSAGGFARFDGSAWQGGRSGLDFNVDALLAFDDGSGEALFVGGQFSSIDGAPFQRIAKWNGSSWSALGAGFPNGSVSALASFDAGAGAELYAGGAFFAASGAPGNSIARWDGSAWSPLGSGVAGGSSLPRVSALMEYDDGSGNALFVGGNFATAGGTPASCIAKWNGSAWSAVGGGVGGGLAPFVRAFCVFDDGSGPALYVGGRFTTAGATSANSIAKWNGSTWSPLSSGTSGSVFTLAAFDDGAGLQLFAGGLYSSIGGVNAQAIARWNGSVWSRLTSQLANSVTGLQVFDDGQGDALFAAGFALPGNPVAMLSRWDGGSWSGLAPGNAIIPNQANAVTTFDDGSGKALYLGGNFTIGPPSDSRLAKYGCAGPRPPSNFCLPSSGTPNGCVATISASGQPDIAHAGSSVLTVSSVDGQRNGLILYGVSGQMSSPWCSGGGSLLCVSPPRQRMSVQSSGGSAGGCDGTLVEDWNAYQLAHPAALGNPWTAGATVDVQAWFRVPTGCKGSALSQGVRLTYQ